MIYNELIQYTVKELSIITGLENTFFYTNKKRLSLEKVYLPSGRQGYIMYCKKFEEILEESRSYDFTMTGFEKYQTIKRPITRQFLNISEVVKFLHLVGVKTSSFSIKRKVREGKIPAYSFKRKYIVPITYLAKTYQLSNAELKEVLSSLKIF